MAIEFEYKAMDNKGKIIEGRKFAEDELDLNRELQREEIRLLSADVVTKFNLKVLYEKAQKIGTVGMHDKILLYRNTASMLNAGLSLARALSIIIRQTKNKKLKSVLEKISDDIKKGSTLSNAFAKHPSVFDSLMISMVTAGEESGNLVDSLNVTADQMEKTYKLQKKIKGAMIYPGVIMTVMIGIAIFMLMFIVPTLTSTFAELAIDLPASTQFIIGMSDFLKNNLVLTLAGLATIFVGSILFIRTPAGLRYFSWVLLRLPVIGLLAKKINSARTTRTLASLLSSGVSFVRSLEIVYEVMQNPYYKDVIKKAQKSIEVGQPISKVFANEEKLYPIFVGEMMAVGEETGELAPMLMKVATYYEDEVDEQTKNLSTIIEPILMVVIGGAVGFFAISMISPMYSLVDSI